MSAKHRFGGALLLACSAGCGFVVAGPASVHPRLAPRPAPQSAQGSAQSSAPSATRYRNYDTLTRDLRAWTDASEGAAALEKIATTVSDRAVWAVTLALPGAVEPAKRPAILIVGGIDGQDVSSSEVALNVAVNLLRKARAAADGPEARLLTQNTLLIVPRANPDGVERFFSSPRDESVVNNRRIDNDRDDAVDEDGSSDLDGDGRIGVMRIRDPEGEWMIDPDEPRLLRKADRNKGETGVYRLMLEGRDDDGDGLIDEDGPGGVDDDRNWPHLFEPGIAANGNHPLSEPETRGLADYVLAHPHIRAAIVYGRNDNLVTVPKGQARGPSGQDYRDLHPDDLALYEQISEKYKALTGYKTLSGARPDGGLYAWLYSQEGLPTFAIRPWWPLDAATSQPATSQAASAPAATQPGEGEGDSDEGAAARPRRGGRSGARGGSGGAPERGARPAGGGPPGTVGGAASGRPPGGATGRGGRRGGGFFAGLFGGGRPASAARADGASTDALAARVESSDLTRKWLKYVDEHSGGTGFIAWKSVQQPTFGEVEIGGLAPALEWNPPPDEIESLTEAQIKFVLDAAAALPRPVAHVVKVANVGGDIWEIQLRIENPSLLPTHLAIARMIGEPGFVVQPKVARERILGGEVTEHVAFAPGHGASSPLRWLIRGSPGETITFRVFARRFGEMPKTVKLEATQPGREEGK